MPLVAYSARAALYVIFPPFYPHRWISRHTGLSLICMSLIFLRFSFPRDLFPFSSFLFFFPPRYFHNYSLEFPIVLWRMDKSISDFLLFCWPAEKAKAKRGNFKISIFVLNLVALILALVFWGKDASVISTSFNKFP